MCLNPVKIWIADGEGHGRYQDVACHRCFQCIDRIVIDFQGRCTAEARTAVASHFVTLTYGRDERGSSDHARAAVFMYSDVQKLLKLLRKWGYPARYFVSGEFGEKKGRVHWHILLFWEKGVPPGIVINDPKFMWERIDSDTGEQAKLRDGSPAWFWEWGFAHFREAHQGSVRYACDYALKELSKGDIGRRPGMSKKPPLGAKYFAALGREYAAKGVAPQGRINEDDGPEAVGQFAYSWTDVQYSAKSSRRGQLVQFHLDRHSATERLFFEAFIGAWEELRPREPLPSSRLLEEFMDPGTHVSVKTDFAKQRADAIFDIWAKARMRGRSEEERERIRQRYLARIQARKDGGHPDPYRSAEPQQAARDDWDYQWRLTNGTEEQLVAEIERRYVEDRQQHWDRVSAWEKKHKRQAFNRYEFGRLLPAGFGYEGPTEGELPEGGQQ